jgi:cell division protein FtsB
MGRRKKTPLLKRLFPYSPFLRILFVIVVMSTVYIAGYSMYHFYEIKVQEARLTEEKKHLLEMQEALQEKKKDLEDPSVIEKKAREDLGLVKEREIPYTSKFFMQIFYRFYNCLYCTPK